MIWENLLYLEEIQVVEKPQLPKNCISLVFVLKLKRHQTKPNCNDFGEEAMRRWWREKDFSDVLNEVSITSERDIESIVSDICNTVINN